MSGTNKRFGVLGVLAAVVGVGAAGFASSNADATVAVSTIPVSMVFTPSQNIDNAFAILGDVNSAGTYLNGEFSYLGNLNADTTYTLTGPNFDPSGSVYGTIVGLAPPATGSTSQNVILGLSSSSASASITNNVPLSSFTNYLSALIPGSISYTNSTGTTYTVSGISISSTDPKTSVDEILNGTYPANLAISSGGITVYDQQTNVIPYTVTLPFVGTVPAVTVGTTFNFNLPVTSDVATDLSQNAIALNTSGELVNFDSPTNVGSITVSTPEPTGLVLFAASGIGTLMVARRRRV